MHGYTTIKIDIPFDLFSIFKKMSSTQEWMEYILTMHVVLVAISVLILIIQFIHVNVNFEMFEKQLAQLAERIGSVETEQYEVHQFLYSPSTKEEIEEEVEESEEVEEATIELKEE
jgi:hypothetical protein